MYERILLPTDGSAGTDAALEHAFGLAETYDAELHALYVVETSAMTPETGTAGVIESFHRVGEEAIEEVEERAEAAGLEAVTGTIAEGAPHREILEYVEENDIDLVVMGTHGRTGLDRYLLGSVAEKVVRLAPVPVLTVGTAE